MQQCPGKSSMPTKIQRNVSSQKIFGNYIGFDPDML